MAKEIVSGIYKIENTVNGKCYIGSAVNFQRRKGLHMWELNKGAHHSQKLQHAWNRYGGDVFVFEVVEVVPLKTELIQREQYWMDALQPWYNIAKVAGSAFGIKRSDETKRKMSEALKGRGPSEEVRAKALAANIGRKQTDAEIAKRSAALTGQRRSDESRKKMSDVQRNKELSPNQVLRMKKMAEANRGRPLSAEHRQRISESIKGRKHTEDAKAKMKGRVVSKETIAKLVGKGHLQIGKKKSPESIAKRIATLSARRMRKEFSDLVTPNLEKEMTAG